MAYMSQENKKVLAPTIKAICKKYGVTATLAVRNHSTLCLNIRKGRLDFLKDSEHDNISVNTYWIEDNHDGEIKDFLLEVKNAMMAGNHDNSDIMTDYFDVGWYTEINVGKWNKPYIYVGD